MAYANHTIEFANAETDTKLVNVVPGRNMQIAVSDPAGDAVYDIVFYLYTAEEKATRILHVSEADKSGPFVGTSIAGFVQLGLNVKTGGSQGVTMEILECKV